jgi:glycosyltransferase involved in cell wall biosynthesis
MKIAIVCCPFKTSYGSYASSLRAELEKLGGSTVQWVGSNCGCGDPVETSRDFQTKDCSYFDMPILVDFRSKTPWKRKARGAARTLILSARAKRYAKLSDGAEVVHFQQILNAYGSKAVFPWLKRPSDSARVVTVHELDPDQQERPETNKTYNLADAVIVHCEDLRQQLIRLGVQPEKVHVMLYGTNVPASAPGAVRDGIVFYGGHKLMTGKGIDTFFKAMAIVKERLGVKMPRLKIHGHFGPVTPDGGRELAATNGLSELTDWLNQIDDNRIFDLYHRSQVSILPFTGSFAGLPASMAGICGLPVVCTRKAGLPDHLGDSGIYIDENNPQQLADAVIELLTDQSHWKQASDRILKRAQENLTWKVIAGKTFKIYQDAIRNRGKVHQHAEEEAMAVRS